MSESRTDPVIIAEWSPIAGYIVMLAIIVPMTLVAVFFGQDLYGFLSESASDLWMTDVETSWRAKRAANLAAIAIWVGLIAYPVVWSLMVLLFVFLVIADVYERIRG